MFALVVWPPGVLPRAAIQLLSIFIFSFQLSADHATLPPVENLNPEVTLRLAFHLVPPDMRGETLYPRNELQRRHPDLYRLAAAEHDASVPLHERRVPGLGNRTWGDVVRLTPLTPLQQYELFLRTSFPKNRIPKLFRSFAVDLDELDCLKLAIRAPRGWDQVIESFDPDRYHELTYVPSETIRYYAHCREEGEPLCRFGAMPLVLHCGPVNVANAEVVDVD